MASGRRLCQTGAQSPRYHRAPVHTAALVSSTVSYEGDCSCCDVAATLRTQAVVNPSYRTSYLELSTMHPRA